MRVTKIAKIGKTDKFGVFIDGVLKIFLSGESILNSSLVVGQELSEAELEKLNRVAASDELYQKSLKYISYKMRSEGELKSYLSRHGADPDVQRSIILRFKKLDLINDERYSEAFIHSKLLNSPASKRKISFALRNKKIAEDIIDKSLNSEQISDEDSLKQIIIKKRRQPKYQDDLKLMQYLVRNGFKYSDIKQALKRP